VPIKPLSNISLSCTIPPHFEEIGANLQSGPKVQTVSAGFSTVHMPSFVLEDLAAFGRIELFEIDRDYDPMTAPSS